MEHVILRHPDERLSLAGRDVPGPDGVASLREAIGQSLTPALRPATRFLGARPRSEISRLMAAADVCVFPSQMETQGIVILEAMASGRPVIAPWRGPGPEVLGPDGDCGLLVNPSDPRDIADKLCRILDDPERAERMGQRGRRRALEHFSVPACLSQNLTFYRQQLRRRER
jgi:glycosyltransferase involved in cell wall biosynthesis